MALAPSVAAAAMPCDRVSQSKDALPPGQLDGQPSIRPLRRPPFWLREGRSLCLAIIILEAEKKKEEVIASSVRSHRHHAIIFYIPLKTTVKKSLVSCAK